MSRKAVLTFTFLSVLLSGFLTFAESGSELIDVTSEMARTLENTNWTGTAGVYLNTTSTKGVQNSAALVFGYLDGRLYYLSKINSGLDKFVEKNSGGLCVKSEPRRIELFKNVQTGMVSGQVYIPKLDSKTGQRSYTKIKLENIELAENASQLNIFGWEISSENGKTKSIPTRYNLSKTDLTVPNSSLKIKPEKLQIVKALRVQLDECLKEKPWLK